jgi:DNA-binding transcriptional regulator/RsmH inhibitor MraZ
MDELFFGSAVCEVNSAGQMLLPRAFVETIRLRSTSPTLLIGLHQDAACLVAFDRLYAMQQQGEGGARPEDQGRLRRNYGFVEQVAISPRGVMTLSALMRSRGHIGQSALVVATGQRFEIWDLEEVLERGPSDLITLATHHLMTQIGREIGHVPALPAPEPRGRPESTIQPGIRLQHLPTMRPRHDPIGRGAVGN